MKRGIEHRLQARARLMEARDQPLGHLELLNDHAGSDVAGFAGASNFVTQQDIFG